MRIYLIRHAESLQNLDDGSSKDYENYYFPITKFGAQQAQATGSALAKIIRERGQKVEMWFSPYTRTTQTKDLILKALGRDATRWFPEISEHYGLREHYYGKYDNLGITEAQRAATEQELAQYEKEKQSLGFFKARPPGGAETFEEVAARVKRFVDAHVYDDNQDLVIVSHRHTLQVMRMLLEGKDQKWLEDYNKSADLGNGDIIMLEGSKEKGFTATVMHESKRRTASLPPDSKQPFGNTHRCRH